MNLSTASGMSMLNKLAVALGLFSLTMLYYAMGLTFDWCTWSPTFVAAVALTFLAVGLVI
jgi:hypothetical protein